MIKLVPILYQSGKWKQPSQELFNIGCFVSRHYQKIIKYVQQENVQC